MTNLYIRNEHCLDIKQLKDYFSNISEDTEVYFNLLDYSRHGDLTTWLEEHGEIELANKISLIEEELGDAEYMNELIKIILSSQAPIVSIQKPLLRNCVDFCISGKEYDGNTLKVSLSYIVRQVVNERYEIKIKTEWGSKGFTLNPMELEESRKYHTEYIFYKRVGQVISRILVFGDEELIIQDNIKAKNAQMAISIVRENPTEKNTVCNEASPDDSYIGNLDSTTQTKRVKPSYKDSCTLQQRRVIEDIIKRMKLVTESEGQFTIFDGNSYRATLSSYYISDLITQSEYGVIMSSSFPYTSPIHLDFNSIIEFINKINYLTSLDFSLPSEAQWLQAVNSQKLKEGTHEWMLDCWDPKIEYKSALNPVCRSLSGNHVVRCSKKTRYSESRRNSYCFRLVLHKHN